MIDKRYLQANKEARLSLYITVFYLISWVSSAYVLGDKLGLVGFPVWFEISCLFTPIVFTLICYLVVKYQFKNIPLETLPFEALPLDNVAIESSSAQNHTAKSVSDE